MELRVGHQARHAHPHARRHRGHRRAADLRAAGRESDARRQLGRDGAARATGSIDYTIDSVFVPEATRTSRSPRLRSAAAASTGSASSASRRCATRGGRAASAGGMLDELARTCRAQKADAPARRPRARASWSSTRRPRARTARRARSCIETWSRRARRRLERGETASRAAAHADPAGDGARDMVGARGRDCSSTSAAGTTALRAGTIQRLFRDMHAGTQHVTRRRRSTSAWAASWRPRRGPEVVLLGFGVADS